MRSITTLLLFTCAAAVSAAPTSGGPNVVMIVSDDQGWNDYSFLKHPQIKTPNIDKLAAQSLTFTRGYVPASLCRPSLMSMMTGLQPHQHRVTGNDPAPIDGAKDRKNPEYLKQVLKLDSYIEKLPTIPRVLDKAGYVTFQTGKWWEGNFTSGGFTGGMSGGDPTAGGRHGDAGLKIGRDTMKPMYDFIDKSAADAKPFFLWYAPMMPHSPHTPPARLFEKYKAMGLTDPVANYYAMVEWFDETCGELLGYLDKKGLADNTLIVYICDNGWIQQPDGNGFDGGSKQSPNEGGTRTPIMLRWPGHITPRMDTTHLAQSIDFLPTIAAACGAKVPAKLPGINLLDDQAVVARKTIYGSIFTHDLADLDRPAASLRYRWIIDGDDKLILPYSVGQSSWLQGVRPELYNVTADPFEKHNLYTADSPRAAELTKLLNQWWQPGRGAPGSEDGEAKPARKAKAKAAKKKAA